MKTITGFSSSPGDHPCSSYLIPIPAKRLRGSLWGDLAMTCIFDSDRKRIYALGGEGFISVIQQNDPNHYSPRANIPTTVGVRTGVFFGTSLYAGVPAAGLEPAQIWNYAVPE